MNLGERIKRLRDMRNLTLEDVGDYIGVNKATVQRYESGNIDIKRNIAIKLSEILQTTPSYIMGWSDEISISNSQRDNYSLSQMEMRIIDSFRLLNKEGQKKAVDYISDLLDTEKYKNKNHAQSNLKDINMEIANELDDFTEEEAVNFIKNNRKTTPVD